MGVSGSWALFMKFWKQALHCTIIIYGPNIVSAHVFYKIPPPTRLSASLVWPETIKQRANPTSAAPLLLYVWISFIR